ncbi:MAG: PfkB family carbohydrate kinase [Gemmatimonadaceae bacterium]
MSNHHSEAHVGPRDHNTPRCPSRVVAVGECTVDRYLDRNEDFVGGISLNFAINALDEGADHVALVSCVGSDSAGDLVRQRLAQTAIETRSLHTREGSTATQAIHLDMTGERTFPPGGYDAGVLADFELDDDDLALVANADIVAVPIFRQLSRLAEPILQRRELGVMRVADLLDGADISATTGDDLSAVDALLDAFDILFISGNSSLVPRYLPLTSHRRSMIVVTHAAEGSTVLNAGNITRGAAEVVPPNEVVDTTGCGDAFQAAFTLSYFQNRDIDIALRAGARRAARVIRHLGATRSDESQSRSNAES